MSPNNRKAFNLLVSLRRSMIGYPVLWLLLVRLTIAACSTQSKKCVYFEQSKCTGQHAALAKFQQVLVDASNRLGLDKS